MTFPLSIISVLKNKQFCVNLVPDLIVLYPSQSVWKFHSETESLKNEKINVSQNEDPKIRLFI